MCRERKIMLAAILCGMVYNIFLDCVSIGADYEGEIAAASAVVMAEDGSCVYEKNADEPRLVASTTKLMTALVAIEASKPDDPIEVRAECCGIEGTSMYLSPGEILTADELIEGLLLASGNDAADCCLYRQKRGRRNKIPASACVAGNGSCSGLCSRQISDSFPRRVYPHPGELYREHSS